jgi:glycosyltransferase involved in cell wall biosynthesis
MGSKTNKNKYLIIGEAFYPEEFLINDLIKVWEKDGYQLEVLTRSPSYPFGKVFKGYRNWLYQKEKWDSINIHRFSVIQGYHKSKVLKILNYFSFVFLGSLIALFIGRRYKKVFIYHTGPLSLAIPAILIKKLFKIPITIWSFDLWPATVYAYGFKKTKALSWFLDNLVSWIYKNCENIIVSSNGFVPEIKKYAPDKTVHVAPNWPQTANIEKKKSSIKLNPEKLHFTFTGNVGKVQNLENVIIGFKNAAVEHAQLNIFGDGSHLEYLISLTKKENIQNVVFHGRVPLNEIADIMEQSHVLLISLMRDPVMELTLPLKFQTYLSVSKPIFAVMEGEVKNLVKEYSIGEVANPDNIEEIAKIFKCFELTRERKDEIKKNCEYLVENTFHREKIISKISSVFFS